MSIRLKACGPTIGDCTTPYDVVIDCDYTVAEFVREIDDGEEFGNWGMVRVSDEPFWYGGTTVCDYGRGRTAWVTHEFDNRKVVSAHAHGGWSCYDFFLVVSDGK